MIGFPHYVEGFFLDYNVEFTRRVRLNHAREQKWVQEPHSFGESPHRKPPVGVFLRGLHLEQIAKHYV